MRWVYLILGVLVLLSILGRLFHYVPGQEDNPSLAKAALCGAAASMHKALIGKSKELGVVLESGIDESGTYVFTVDEAMWTKEPVTAKELIAIAGWCQVAGEHGRAVALVISNRGKNDLASVVDGEFTESKSSF